MSKGIDVYSDRQTKKTVKEKLKIERQTHACHVGMGYIYRLYIHSMYVCTIYIHFVD